MGCVTSFLILAHVLSPFMRVLAAQGIKVDIHTSESVEAALVELLNAEKSIIESAAKMLKADDGNLFPVDLLAIGAVNRTSSNLKAFQLLIDAKNMITARSLLRLQIDTFLRFAAVWLVDKPHDFANLVIDGKEIRNIKDRDGKRMTDGYLVDKLSIDYPWVKTVYKKLCGYVHFSNSHLFSSVRRVDSNDRTIIFELSTKDANFPESSWVEIIDCFTHSVCIFLYYLNSWTVTKDRK